jgi:hypothetical protein
MSAECSDSTSQETYYDSHTKPNRLMLFGETVAVYFEKYTEHTTLCGQNVKFVPHRELIISTLQKLTGLCCMGKDSLFIVRKIRNTQIQFVGRM